MELWMLCSQCSLSSRHATAQAQAAQASCEQELGEAKAELCGAREGASALTEQLSSVRARLQEMEEAADSDEPKATMVELLLRKAEA